MSEQLVSENSTMASAGFAETVQKWRDSFRLVRVRLFDFLYLVYKLTTNTIKMPYYLVRDSKYFVFDYAKTIVDRTINLKTVYDRHIPSVDLRDIRKMLKGPEPKINVLFENAYGNINFQEAVSMSYIIQALQPKRLFEIGTFDGFSTYHLAMNAPEDAQVYTLNLPPDSTFEEYSKLYSLTEYRGDLVTHQLGKSLGIGRLYRESSVAHKVKQLYGDSLKTDFSAFKNSIDFCFVDGGHSYIHLENDSRNAMSMLTGRGVIVWHDYNTQHRDIFKFLNRFSQSHKLFHIKETRLVVYFGPDIQLSELSN